MCEQCREVFAYWESNMQLSRLFSARGWLVPDVAPRLGFPAS